jgi:hypothetical protein
MAVQWVPLAAEGSLRDKWSQDFSEDVRSSSAARAERHFSMSARASSFALQSQCSYAENLRFKLGSLTHSRDLLNSIKIEKILFAKKPPLLTPDVTENSFLNRTGASVASQQQPLERPDFKEAFIARRWLMETHGICKTQTSVICKIM